MRSMWLCVALVLSLAVGCSDGSGPARSAGSSSSANPETSVVSTGPPSPPCPHHQEQSTGIASQRNLNHHVDASPDSYDPPGDAKPAIDAGTALRLSEHTGAPIGNPVEAVLATLTTGDGVTSLVWVFTVTDVEVAPSLGPPVCADVAKVVDATTAKALYGLTGTSFR